MIGTILSVLTGVIAIFPFIITFFIILFYKGLGRKPKFKTVADVTTFLLFFSVYIIAHTIFGDGVGYIILISALGVMILYASYERRQVKDFQIIRFLRKVWRLFFLLLFATYLLLILIGLVLKVIEHVM